MKDRNIKKAEPVVTGIEDRFHFVISDECISCGACAEVCPAGAVAKGGSHYEIDPEKCIDCGTCSAVCPTGAAESPMTGRDSISVPEPDAENVYFNPGCALCIYKPDVARLMDELLKEHFSDLKCHEVCCRHEPGLPEGSVIINNCAGCDRRFRSLYSGIDTISFWEVADSFDDLELPDYGGVTMSVHDSCGFRHKPQVHAAVRSLLRKMNIDIEEAEHHGMTSECCGDNLYGLVPNGEVQRRMRQRASEFPCDDVVVYCIGCERSLLDGGKTPHYLPDLIFGRKSRTEADDLDEYHSRLADWIKDH
ncbi:MAG: 4Fe-4S binding protein [Anaerovoracaceae bacterium]|nr:4Fe-4S binding protein [Anaerovoracaceae bacterium]